MKLFKGKYRTDTIRLKGWDYASCGSYFLTICAKGAESVFGKVIDGKMQLSEWGRIVESEWLKSFEIRPELIKDEFCIMPNHLHGIVHICKNDAFDQLSPGKKSTPEKTEIVSGALYRRPRSISSFVALFKTVTTMKVNALKEEVNSKLWQSGYHDYIIRNVGQLRRIRKYIRDNPRAWAAKQRISP